MDKRLKCGGLKKRKKYQDGGDVGKLAELMNLLKSDTTAGSNLRTGIGGAGSAVGEGVSSIIKSGIDNNYDWRVDPYKQMRSNAAKENAGDLAGGALKGAAMGTAILPGIGTLVGGILGTGKAIFNMISGKKKDMAQEASKGWSTGMETNYGKALASSGYKKGGITTRKARKILGEDNPTLHKHPITPKQKRWLGWIAGGSKPRKYVDG